MSAVTSGLMPYDKLQTLNTKQQVKSLWNSQANTHEMPYHKGEFYDNIFLSLRLFVMLSF